MFIPFILLPTAMQEQIRACEARTERELNERMLTVPVEEFTPAAKWRPLLRYSAESWKRHNEPIIDSPVSLLNENKGFVRPDGSLTDSPERWTYRNVLLPKGERIRTLLGTKLGWVAFDGDVPIPTLAHDGEPWMSYTPMEFFTLRPALPHATGRVLVAGLGLGYQLRMLAAKKSVRSIVVVENDLNIARWMSGYITPEVRAKLEEVVHADAYEFTRAWMHNYDSIVWDIWQKYGRAKRDYHWNKIRRAAEAAGKKTWAWGQSGPPSVED